MRSLFFFLQFVLSVFSIVAVIVAEQGFAQDVPRVVLDAWKHGIDSCPKSFVEEAKLTQSKFSEKRQRIVNFEDITQTSYSEDKVFTQFWETSEEKRSATLINEFGVFELSRTTPTDPWFATFVPDTDEAKSKETQDQMLRYARRQFLSAAHNTFDLLQMAESKQYAFRDWKGLDDPMATKVELVVEPLASAATTEPPFIKLEVTLDKNYSYRVSKSRLTQNIGEGKTLNGEYEFSYKLDNAPLRRSGYTLRAIDNAGKEILTLEMEKIKFELTKPDSKVFDLATYGIVYEPGQGNRKSYLLPIVGLISVIIIAGLVYWKRRRA